MPDGEEELKKQTNNNTKKNNLPDKGEREKEEAGLKFNILKTKFMASGPITSWQIDGETVSDFIFGEAPKSLQMVIAAMKLEDAYFLEGRL